MNDPLNRPVSGLEKENFRVFDNKVEQTITQFAMDDEPVAVGLVFDTSGSMGDKLRRSRMAAKEFFKTANPEDEFFLVEFDNQPRLEVPLTYGNRTDRKPIDVFAVQWIHRAAGCHLHGAARDEEVEEEQEGAAHHLRRRRQQQPLHRARKCAIWFGKATCLIYAIGVFGGGSTPEEAGGPGTAHPHRRADRRADVSCEYRRPARHRRRRSASNCAIVTCWDTRPPTRCGTASIITSW